MKSKTSHDNKQLLPQKYTVKLGDEIKAFAQDVDKFENAIKNPVMLGSLQFALLKERERFNEFLADLNKTLSALDDRLAALEDFIQAQKAPVPQAPQILGPKDQEVYDFVSENEKVCAEDIQEKFGYKGKNAASARLSKLYTVGKLEKIQSGRRVYYTIKS